MLQSDPFTQSAQDAAMRALELMQHYGHSLVDTEHLCLALVEQSEGTIPDILQVLDVDPATITQRLHQELPRLRLPSFISSDVDRVFITSRLKQIIDRSNQEAAKRKDDHISAEHLLLGIASE